MASDYQSLKRQERKEKMMAQRERRKMPLNERKPLLGLGVNRSKLLPKTQQADQKKAPTKAEKEPPAAEPEQKKNELVPERRDTIEISPEALRRYQEAMTASGSTIVK